MLYATMRIGNNCEYFLFQSIDESVLLLSLTGNLTVFKNTRITMALITCIAMYRSDIYYSGVGYCLFVFGFCQNLLSDKQITPHFLF